MSQVPDAVVPSDYRGDGSTGYGGKLWFIPLFAPIGAESYH